MQSHDKSLHHPPQSSERFNVQTFLPVPTAKSTLAIDFFNTPKEFLNASYAALRVLIYGARIMQTRLKPYLDEISLMIDASGIALDFSAMEAANDLEWRKEA